MYFGKIIFVQLAEIVFRDAVVQYLEQQEESERKNKLRKGLPT